MAIETAKDLYVANGADLRHWHDVSSDIIKYLKDKLNRAAEAVVYKGKLANEDAFNSLAEPPVKGDAWTNEETGVNMMWNGNQWIPVSLFRLDFDREPVENSLNGIQSGYIWTALQNFIDDPTIYRIVGEADQDPELQDYLHDISNQLADLMQDLEDLTRRFNQLPEPLVSPEEDNEIVRAEDGGLYFNSEDSRLEERVLALESARAREVESVIQTNGTYMTIGENSPEVTFIEAYGDISFNFESLPRMKWTVKHIYIESFNDINLSFENASFADVSEDPRYGRSGYAILIRCTWIAGKVVLEVLDNSQMYVNVEDWNDGVDDSSNP